MADERELMKISTTSSEQLYISDIYFQDALDQDNDCAKILLVIDFWFFIFDFKGNKIAQYLIFEIVKGI